MANKKIIIYISAAILVVGVAVYSTIKYLNKKKDSENVNEEKEPLFEIDTVLEGNTPDDFNVQFTFGDVATGYGTFEKQKNINPYRNKKSEYKLQIDTYPEENEVRFDLLKKNKFLKTLKRFYVP